MKRELDFSKARRGPLVPTDPHKTRVTIWLDTKLLDYLMSIVDRAGGGSYEDLIDELLRQRILSSGREVPLVKSRALKNGSGRDKLFAALKILDSGEASALHSGRSNSTRRNTRRVPRNEKTPGGKAARRFDFEA